MNSFFAYMLKCSDGSYYVGHTDNIEQRIAQHNSGEFICYTTQRLPIKLVWSQDFGSRDEAFNAERAIKNWSRKKKEALIAENFSLLSNFAKKKFNGIPRYTSSKDSALGTSGQKKNSENLNLTNNQNSKIKTRSSRVIANKMSDCIEGYIKNGKQ